VEVLTRLDDFERLHTKLFVVVQAKPEVLKTFLARHPYPIPFLSDPSLSAYRHFHLKRNSLVSFLRPWEVWNYLKIIFSGYTPTLPYEGEDYQQLGGDFLLNRQGEVIYSAKPVGATDRPSAVELLAAIPKL